MFLSINLPSTWPVRQAAARLVELGAATVLFNLRMLCAESIMVGAVTDYDILEAQLQSGNLYSACFLVRNMRGIACPSQLARS